VVTVEDDTDFQFDQPPHSHPEKLTPAYAPSKKVKKNSLETKDVQDAIQASLQEHADELHQKESKEAQLQAAMKLSLEENESHHDPISKVITIFLTQSQASCEKSSGANDAEINIGSDFPRSASDQHHFDTPRCLILLIVR
jgi:hypothetical protein